MLFFDTNVIVYSIINQDPGKLRVSQQLINDALDENSILVSPLILQELVFTLGKLGIAPGLIEENFDLWLHFSVSSIDNGILKDAFSLSKRTNRFKSFNDVVHLKFAERYCDKLITFDGDFNKFRPYTDLEIDIL